DGKEGIRGLFLKFCTESGPGFSQKGIDGTKNPIPVQKIARHQYQYNHKDPDTYGQFLLYAEQGKAFSQKPKDQPYCPIGQQPSGMVYGKLDYFFKAIGLVQRQHKSNGATHAQAV